jgi:hypothetical protein
MRGATTRREIGTGSQFRDSGPSSGTRVPFLDSGSKWKKGRDSNRHIPAPLSGGLPVCTGPDFKKKEKIQKQIPRIFAFLFSRSKCLDCLDARGQAAALASNDAVQSYSQLLSSV